MDCIGASAAALAAARKREYAASVLDSWTCIGQSFGGFVAVEGLCVFPRCTAGAMLFGGLPGLRAWPEDVYHHTMERMRHMSNRFDAECPEASLIMQKLWQMLLPSQGRCDISQHTGLPWVQIRPMAPSVPPVRVQQGKGVASTTVAAPRRRKRSATSRRGKIGIGIRIGSAEADRSGDVGVEWAGGG